VRTTQTFEALTDIETLAVRAGHRWGRNGVGHCKQRWRHARHVAAAGASTACRRGTRPFRGWGVGDRAIRSPGFANAPVVNDETRDITHCGVLDEVAAGDVEDHPTAVKPCRKDHMEFAAALPDDHKAQIIRGSTRFAKRDIFCNRKILAIAKTTPGGSDGDDQRSATPGCSISVLIPMAVLTARLTASYLSSRASLEHLPVGANIFLDALPLRLDRPLRRGRRQATERFAVQLLCRHRR
jgi:hypothetical protein